jgi:hypothetical protein
MTDQQEYDRINDKFLKVLGRWDQIENKEPMTALEIEEQKEFDRLNAKFRLLSGRP